jgi:hypothetical protein
MVLFTRLGDRGHNWLTINEAKVIAEQGYQYGRMAPGKTDLRAAGTVIHHLNLAHGRALTAFRAAKAKGRIGPCRQLAPCYPADQSEEAAAAAQTADVTENTLYLDPLLKARYPDLSKLDSKLAAGPTGSCQTGGPGRRQRSSRLPRVNYSHRLWSTVKGRRSSLIRSPPQAGSRSIREVSTTRSPGCDGSTGRPRS